MEIEMDMEMEMEFRRWSNFHAVMVKYNFN